MGAVTREANTNATIKRLMSLLATLTYKETARVLWKEGYRTSEGNRITEFHINYLVYKNKLSPKLRKARRAKH